MINDKYFFNFSFSRQLFKKLPIGQGWLLQVCVTESSVLQFLPPYAGSGLVHVLVLVWFPPPQVKLQEPQADQSVQLPSGIMSF